MTSTQHLPYINIKTYKEKINSKEAEYIELTLTNVGAHISELVNTTLIENDCYYFTADDLTFQIFTPSKQQRLEIVHLYDRIYGMCWRMRDKHKQYEKIRRMLT